MTATFTYDSASSVTKPTEIDNLGYVPNMTYDTMRPLPTMCEPDADEPAIIIQPPLDT